LVLGCWILVAAGGCVSLDSYRKLQAQNRRMAADKEALNQEMFALRSGQGSIQTRLDACETEVATKDELIANLRSENDVLDEMRRLAQAELEKLANRQELGDVVIAGPKLPEQLDTALKRFADQHPSAVEYDSRRGSIKWKSDLLFALGSDVVKESSQEALKQFSEIIKSPSAEDFEVIVVGHTDNRPISRPQTKEKHPTNWHLSAHRAISVANVLLGNGYDAGRTGVMGCGEYRPVASNTTEEGRSQNRRVDIYLIPSGSIVRAALGWEVDSGRFAFARLAD